MTARNDNLSYQATEKLGKAKAALVLEEPFFATVICSLPFIEMPADSKSVPTMATDGRRFFYNPAFINDMDHEEVKFVLSHEVGHCIFQHMTRRGQRNAKRWNFAGDYIINDMLVRESIGKMPANGLHNPALVTAGGNTTEGVYDLLPESDGQGGGEGGYDGSPTDLCMDAGETEAEQAETEAELKVLVAQARDNAKMAGKLSANIARFVDNALKPKVDWKDILRRFVSARAKVDYSFARPKRRFVSQDIYLPSLMGEKLGQIAIAVDCSGSVGEKELSEFAAEMRAIQADCMPAETHVLYFDSDVCHYDHFEQGDDLTIEPHGGGGTAFSPVMRYLDEHGIEPEACVFLTDLYCSDFGEPPPYPVLFITNGATSAPWGEVVEMDPKC